MIDTAIKIATDLCKRFEGLRLRPYACPAGVATVGYGATRYEDGRKVALDDPPITKERAEELLQVQLVYAYMLGVLKASPSVIAYPETLGALTDFAYNLGVHRYRASTLRKRIEAEDWEGAEIEIKKWRRAGGRVLLGLVLRRAAEAEFLGG